MKERIYTIPVNDAFAEDSECALCWMEHKLTESLVTYFLGASLMEPDVRQTTNEKGFCREHATALYNRRENPLGLGLLLHTHATEAAEDAKSALTHALPVEGVGRPLRRRTDVRAGLVEAAERIERRTRTCAMCERLQSTMDRYVDVVLWQYFEEREFRTRFDTCKGFCLTHTARLLRGAAKYLDAAHADAFGRSLARVTGANLDRMSGELEWFTLMHDYRNKDKSWGHSKDAIPRMLKKLKGDLDLR